MELTAHKCLGFWALGGLTFFYQTASSQASTPCCRLLGHAPTAILQCIRFTNGQSCNHECWILCGAWHDSNHQQAMQVNIRQERSHKAAGNLSPRPSALSPKPQVRWPASHHLRRTGPCPHRQVSTLLGSSASRSRLCPLPCVSCQLHGFHV